MKISYNRNYTIKFEYPFWNPESSGLHMEVITAYLNTLVSVSVVPGLSVECPPFENQPYPREALTRDQGILKTILTSDVTLYPCESLKGQTIWYKVVKPTESSISLVQMKEEEPLDDFTLIHFISNQEHAQIIQELTKEEIPDELFSIAFEYTRDGLAKSKLVQIIEHQVLAARYLPISMAENLGIHTRSS